MSFSCPKCGVGLDVRVAGASGGPSRRPSGPPSEKLTGASVAREIESLLANIEDVLLTGDFEPGFVADMRQRIEKYGDKIFVSDRQMGRLRQIASTCGVD